MSGKCSTGSSIPVVVWTTEFHDDAAAAVVLQYPRFEEYRQLRSTC